MKLLRIILMDKLILLFVLLLLWLLFLHTYIHTYIQQGIYIPPFHLDHGGCDEAK